MLNEDASLKCTKRIRRWIIFSLTISDFYLQHYQLPLPVYCFKNDQYLSRLSRDNLQIAAPNSNVSQKSTREKGRDLTQSYDKSPYTHRKIKDSVVKGNLAHNQVRTLMRYNPSGWCLTYLRLFKAQTLTVTNSTTVWNKQDKHALARWGMQMSMSADGEKKGDSSAAFDVRPDLFEW